MRQDRLTLWKIQVVILLAAVFCAVIRAAGLITGVALIFLLIPLWSVAVWLMLTERQSTILGDAAASVLGFCSSPGSPRGSPSMPSGSRSRRC